MDRSLVPRFGRRRLTGWVFSARDLRSAFVITAGGRAVARAHSSVVFASDYGPGKNACPRPSFDCANRNGLWCAGTSSGKAISQPAYVMHGGGARRIGPSTRCRSRDGGMPETAIRSKWILRAGNRNRRRTPRAHFCWHRGGYGTRVWPARQMPYRPGSCSPICGRSG